jgi:hypothetical protein
VRLEGVRVDKVEKVSMVLTLPENVDQKLNWERYNFLKDIGNFC